MALWKKIFHNVIFAIVFPFALLFFRISRIGVKYQERIDCIGDCADVIPMIPESLKQRHAINLDVYYGAGYGLSHGDMKYLLPKIFSYLYAPTFLLHIVLKIARYSNIVRRYKPDVIICHNEYSFSSSALTDYCRYHGINHINIMHGERLINIRNAFFEYDKCYVWHEHYKNLYLLMRSGTKPEDFIIEVPAALKINVDKDFDQSAFANYKYYLGDQSFEELRQIVDSLAPLKEKGYSIKFRPHPRYTISNDLAKLVKKEEIEFPSAVRIATSIASCDYVIGSFSTVLLQAYLCGKCAVVDDITYASRIELQKKARHLLLSVEGPKLLSDCIKAIS